MSVYRFNKSININLFLPTILSSFLYFCPGKPQYTSRYYPGSDPNSRQRLTPALQMFWAAWSPVFVHLCGVTDLPRRVYSLSGRLSLLLLLLVAVSVAVVVAVALSAVDQPLPHVSSLCVVCSVESFLILNAQCVFERKNLKTTNPSSSDICHVLRSAITL